MSKMASVLPQGRYPDGASGGLGVGPRGTSDETDGTIDHAFDVPNHSACATCRLHVPWVVPKTIQIRDVPDDVHAELRARAATARLSLSEYMLRECTRIAERPVIADVLRRASRREWGVAPGEAVAVLRVMRNDER